MITGFTTDLIVKSAPQFGKRFFTLCDPLRYYSSLLGYVVQVPEKFPTDLVSFAILDVELHGQTDAPAVLHDYLYASGEHRKTVCDLVFYEALRASGMGKIRAGLRFLAVFLSPPAHFVYHAHRRGVTHGAKFLKG
jgi:hypothetical protein